MASDMDGSLSDLEDTLTKEMDQEDEQDCLSQKSGFSNLSQDSCNNDSGLSSCADDDDVKSDLAVLLKRVGSHENYEDSLSCSEIPRCQTPTESILRRDSNPSTPSISRRRKTARKLSGSSWMLRSRLARASVDISSASGRQHQSTI